MIGKLKGIIITMYKVTLGSWEVGLMNLMRG